MTTARALATGLKDGEKVIFADLPETFKCDVDLYEFIGALVKRPDADKIVFTLEAFSQLPKQYTKGGMKKFRMTAKEPGTKFHFVELVPGKISFQNVVLHEMSDTFVLMPKAILKSFSVSLAKPAPVFDADADLISGSDMADEMFVARRKAEEERLAPMRETLSQKMAKRRAGGCSI